LLATVGKFFIDKLPGFIQGPFKAALGIHSPSTVFRSYGQNLIQGLVDGLNAGQDAVRKAADGVASAASLDIPVTNVALAATGRFTGATANGNASTSGQQVINYNLNVTTTQSDADINEQFRRMQWSAGRI
jgi:hypothetical protein